MHRIFSYIVSQRITIESRFQKVMKCAIWFEGIVNQHFILVAIVVALAKYVSGQELSVVYMTNAATAWVLEN